MSRRFGWARVTTSRLSYKWQEIICVNHAEKGRKSILSIAGQFNFVIRLWCCDLVFRYASNRVERARNSILVGRWMIITRCWFCSWFWSWNLDFGYPFATSKSPGSRSFRSLDNSIRDLVFGYASTTLKIPASRSFQSLDNSVSWSDMRQPYMASVVNDPTIQYWGCIGIDWLLGPVLEYSNTGSRYSLMLACH